MLQEFTLESCRFSRERLGQVLALSSTCRAGQESHPSRAKSDQTPGLHSGKGRLQTGLRGSRGWELREEREMLCRWSPPRHLISRVRKQACWAGSSLQICLALPLGSDAPEPSLSTLLFLYPTPRATGPAKPERLHYLNSLLTPLHRMYSVRSPWKGYWEPLSLTLEGPTIKSGCFKLKDGLMHPRARLCQVCSDLEGGMVPPACFNSSLCGTQSFPTMRNHAAQRLASLAGTQGGAGAGGEGLGEEKNGPEWYFELLSHLKVPSFSAFPYPCAPASSPVVSHSDHLLPPPPSHLGFCLPGAH